LALPVIHLKLFSFLAAKLLLLMMLMMSLFLMVFVLSLFLMMFMMLVMVMTFWWMRFLLRRVVEASELHQLALEN
jgi:hypothetical protein